MSQARTFFRYCPACGKRFHIRVVGKEFVGGREEEIPMTWEDVAASVGYGQGVSPIPLEQGTPVTVDVEDFRYTYKCKHCGHVWTEIHEKEEER